MAKKYTPVDAYLSHVTPLSDQVTKRELAIILQELDRVLESNTKGDVVEFGCYEGTTSVHLATWLKRSQRILYLYDSFQGLPEKTSHDQSPAGMQFVAGELKASRRTLEQRLKQTGAAMPVIKKAWFSQLTARDVPHKIAFAFLDGDYYDSVKQPLKLITSYLAPGATIIVDDYANEALPGAARAVDEWVCANKHVTIRVEASLAILRT